VSTRALRAKFEPLHRGDAPFGSTPLGCARGRQDKENAEKGEAKLHRRDAQSADANLGGLFPLASTAEQKHVNSYGQGNQSYGGQ
jgi:hypothetical protein